MGIGGACAGEEQLQYCCLSPVVAQRLRKLDFPVKGSEEPNALGADKNHFLRPRGPGEDTGKVSATDP